MKFESLEKASKSREKTSSVMTCTIDLFKGSPNTDRQA